MDLFEDIVFVALGGDGDFDFGAGVGVELGGLVGCAVAVELCGFPEPSVVERDLDFLGNGFVRRVIDGDQGVLGGFCGGIDVEHPVEVDSVSAASVDG